MTENEMVNAVASAGLLIAARCAQYDNLIGGSLAGPPEESLDDWIMSLVDMLKPLGNEEAARICHAITYMLEHAPNIVGYLTVIDINRSMMAAGAPSGVVEFTGPGCETGGHFPGCGNDPNPIREMVDVRRVFRRGSP